MKRNTGLSVVTILVFAAALLGVAASSLFALQGSDAQKAETVRAEAKGAEEEVVVKTYPLRYINYHEVWNAARMYLLDASGSDNTVTVRILKTNIPDFEALLKKLDVEKKNIVFTVYTIIAARDNAPDIVKRPETKEIDNRDLKLALDEIKGLWNFKHYWVDAPSVLTVKDGSMSNYCKLVSSQYNFGLLLASVRLVGDEPGKRIISVGSVRLTQYTNPPSEEQKSTIIDTRDVSVKEKGYLVVGVSGVELAPSGLALILVISSEIK
jgi:hypothetical protein